MGRYDSARARFLAFERNLPDGLREGAYGAWRGVKRAGQRLPHRGRPLPITVSAYCIYRGRNAAIVRAFVEGLPPGSVAHLHALDVADPSLEESTRSAGPGLRMPLLQALIDANPPRPRDYVLVFDDDVTFVGDGLRAFPGLAARARLDVAQPAHAVGSLKTYRVNAFAPLSTARLTRYVEVGPVVLFSPRALPHVLPFPSWARMGWGVDVTWSALAAEGLRLGVVDATPVLHVGPVGTAYNTSDESDLLGRALAEAGVSSIDDIAQGMGQVWRPWRSAPPWTQGARARPARSPDQA